MARSARHKARVHTKGSCSDTRLLEGFLEGSSKVGAS